MSGGLQVETPDLVTSAYFTAITPSDSTVLSDVRALYVGGAGTVVTKNSNGDSVSFECPAGVTLFISPTRVMAATDASLIVALY